MARKIRIGGLRLSVVQIVFPIIAVVALVGVVGGCLILQRQSNVARAQSWTPVAGACPTESKAEYLARGERALHVSNYDDIHFGRGYGYVTCNEIGSDGGRGGGVVSVCQFNNPTVLRVGTTRVETFFVTGSHGATVLVEDGRPRCVLAANQKLQ